MKSFFEEIVVSLRLRFFHRRITDVVVLVKYAGYFHYKFWLSFLPEQLLKGMKKKKKKKTKKANESVTIDTIHQCPKINISVTLLRLMRFLLNFYRAQYILTSLHSELQAKRFRLINQKHS